MDELEVKGDNAAKKKKDSVSPKVTRPKLPKFSSATLGHHHRHKTDPGGPEEIKSLMEEIKKWKDGSIFDKSLIRPKVIKPRTIPKAHSTQASPKGSPPPGSPSTVGRSSSLNRNRSKSLRLLTDKLKSGRSGQTSPKQVPKIRKNDDSGSFEADETSENVSADRESSPFVSKDNSKKERAQSESDYNQDKVHLTESIPEKDEKDIDDEKDDVSPERGQHRSELLFKIKDPCKSSPRVSEDEGIGDNDNDSPTGASFTPHAIDRNSEFLRLRQMAPKRRPGYAGLTLPKAKLPLYKSDERIEEGGVRKPNKLDLSGGGSARKTSGGRFSTHPPQSKSAFHEDGAMDTNGFGTYRSPSFERPPSLPDEFHEVPSDGSLTDSQLGTDEGAESEAVFPDSVETTVEEETTATTEVEKLEKRNGKSPKQKSKSDPSGNKTFNFDVQGVINSSQSQSFPGLGMNDKKKSESLDDDLKEIQINQERRKSENVNDGENENNSVSVSASDQSKSYGTSLSEDMILSPQSEYSDAFEDPMSQSVETEDFSNKMETSESVQESGGDDQEQDETSMDDSMCSYDNSVPVTPANQSPSGTIDRTHNWLSVPAPKRPVLRSVSSASVLTRERKYSGGNLKEKSESGIRKHSIPGGDEVAPSEKPMDFLPIGESANTLAVSMPSVWRANRLASESPDRDAPFKKVSKILMPSGPHRQKICLHGLRPVRVQPILISDRLLNFNFHQD